MKPNLKQNKAIVRWGLIVVLALDVILAGINLQLNQSPRVSPTELKRLEIEMKSYKADLTRLEQFRRELPQDEKQWDEFYGTHFRPEGVGYSAISDDIGALSRSAGLRTDTITFHQHGSDARGLMEVDIATAVEGDYDSLISFLNKLEHSANFYVLDGLALASSSAGKLRLNLQLRTYFRT